jgi:hypothetical protein
MHGILNRPEPRRSVKRSAARCPFGSRGVSEVVARPLREVIEPVPVRGDRCHGCDWPSKHGADAPHLNEVIAKRLLRRDGEPDA